MNAKIEDPVLLCLLMKRNIIRKTLFTVSSTDLSENRLSLSRLRLSRITAFIWSLLNTKIEQNVIKYCRNEEKFTGVYIIFLIFAQGAISPLFINIFNISILRSQFTYSFVKCGCSIFFFPQFCKSDISIYGYLEVFQRAS